MARFAFSVGAIAIELENDLDEVSKKTQERLVSTVVAVLDHVESMRPDDEDDLEVEPTDG